jgi:hypothetical protein
MAEPNPSVEGDDRAVEDRPAARERVNQAAGDLRKASGEVGGVPAEQLGGAVDPRKRADARLTLPRTGERDPMPNVTGQCFGMAPFQLKSVVAEWAATSQSNHETCLPALRTGVIRLFKLLGRWVAD